MKPSSSAALSATTGSEPSPIHLQGAISPRRKAGANTESEIAYREGFLNKATSSGSK